METLPIATDPQLENPIPHQVALEHSQLGAKPEASNDTMSTFDFNSETFRNALVEKGCISEDTFNSGVLDSFEHDDEPSAEGSDALAHILIGGNGGLHHLRTVMELGINNVEVASKVDYVEDSTGVRLKAKYIKEQTVSETGVYTARHIKWVDKDGILKDKKNGTTLFPDEWSTDKVILAIAEACVAQPESINEKEHIAVHIKEIDGIKVKALVDTRTNKIFQANPVAK